MDETENCEQSLLFMREHNWLDSDLVAQRLEHITPILCATQWFGSHNGE